MNSSFTRMRMAAVRPVSSREWDTCDHFTSSPASREHERYKQPLNFTFILRCSSQAHHLLLVMSFVDVHGEWVGVAVLFLVAGAHAELAMTSLPHRLHTTAATPPSLHDGRSNQAGAMVSFRACALACRGAAIADCHVHLRLWSLAAGFRAAAACDECACIYLLSAVPTVGMWLAAPTPS